MDLSTTYMGLELKNPIIVSSSRLTSKIKKIKKCAKRGAGAIVLKSLFEEQLLSDPAKLMAQDDKYFWFPEAVDFLNSHAREQGLAEYLSLIKEAKQETDIPIIASINCTTPNEWPKFAAKLEEAGADGLELNIAILPFDAGVSSLEIEDTYVEIVSEVKKYVSIPVGVKIGPFFTNTLGLVKRLETAGADAVVIFNRFHRPDIDLDNLKVVQGDILSSPTEMTLSLRWVSILSGKVSCDIAANTGIHDVDSVVKQLLAGAAAIQISSVLFKNGIKYLESLVSGLEKWGAEHNYAALNQIQGKLGGDEGKGAAFERVQFMKKTLTDI